MSEPQPPSKPPPLSPEEVTRLLKIAARRRRPWSVWSVLFCVLLVGVPLGLLVWWLWPRPAPPHLRVLTFDEVAAPGEPVTLRAQLQPAEDEDPDVSLAGVEVYFRDASGPQPASKETWEEQAVSGADGVATARWQPPALAGGAAFQVHFRGDRRQAGASDLGRVFAWPATTPVLIVEPQSTLTGAPASAWRTAVGDVPRLSAAPEALHAARGKGYQIVYLALASDQPLMHHKLRDWVRLRPPAGQKPFPDGPVLGRPSYAADMDEARARREVLGELRQRFTGPLVAVVRQAEAAEAFRQAGLAVLLVAPGEAAQGATRVGSWAELPAKLPIPPKGGVGGREVP
jgi:hypothetical protein